MEDQNQRVPMTAEGKIKMEEELKRLQSEERPRIIRAIEEARAHGDLSENAEYSAAKEQQGQTEARIRDLEDKIARSEVIPPQTGTPTRVVFGVEVKIVDTSSEKESTYRIVGDYESDPQRSRISVNSPMGRALIGKEAGDEVTVRTPGGLRSYEVLSIKP